MNIWVEGARPKTLIASLSPVLIGGAIALSEGIFHPFIFFLTLLFALSIQVGTNFANDYLDFEKGIDTEKRKGPRRLTQSGLVSVKTMKKATMIAFGLAALLATYLTFSGGWIFALLATLAICLGYLYTGGPCPLSSLGIADLLVLIFFGPIPVAGTLYLQTKELSLTPFIAGLAPGLISVAILTSNNLRDIDEDQIAGKKTLPVRFGVTFGQCEYICCLTIASLIPVVLVKLTTQLSLLLATASLILAYPLMRDAYQKKHFERLLEKTGKWMILYTLTFITGWLL